jgi:hypothetical protein
VVKNLGAVELRVVAAAVLAVAADAVLAAHHLQNPMLTGSLEAGSTRE